MLQNRLFISLLMLLILPFAHANEADSIQALINSTNDVKAKTEWYIELGNYWRNKKITKAEEAFKQAVVLAESLDDKSLMAQAYLGFGIVHGRFHRRDSAYYYYKEALVRFKELDDKLLIGRTLNSLGLLNYKQGNYSEASKCFDEALAMPELENDKELLTMLYGNMSLLYKRIGDYLSSLEYSQKSIDLCREQNDLYGLSKILSNHGLLYGHLGKHKTAIKYHLESIEVRKQLGNLSRLAYPLHNIGLAYEGLKQYDEALDYYQQSLDIKKKVNDEAGIARSYNNIGIIHKSKGEYEQALYYLEESLKIKKKLGLKSGIIHTEVNIANLFKDKGEHIKAIDYYLTVLKSKRKIIDNSELLRVYKGLYSCYKSVGNLELAIDYLEKFNVLEDEQINEETNKQIANLEVKYLTKETVAKNLNLLQQNEIISYQIKLRNIYSLLLALVLLLVLVLAFQFYKSKIRVAKTNQLLQNRNEEITHQAKELERVNEDLVKLTHFKDDVNSMLVHDLKNPLNTIINLPKQLDVPDKDNMIINAGKQMLQLVLNMLDVNQYEQGKLELNKGKCHFSEILIQAIEEVSFLARTRSLTIKDDSVQDVLLEVDAELIKRVLVNLLSNAIKFSPLDGIITCEGEVKSGMFTFKISDQGPGISEDLQGKIFDRFESSKGFDTGLKSTGLGLSFCRMAIEAHSGSIDVSSELNKGATFILSLNVEESPSSVIEDIKENHSRIDSLSIDCKNTLVEFLQTMQSMELYQLSELEVVISDFDKKGICEVSSWLQQLREAIQVCDESRYNELINQMNEVLEL
ncbi:tetratricopeptide repeat-containing sensor histidine kinase [Carboxylicivirga sp. N1Y90]|uniref:tetratricopeptide repeat-containing sensor histidine kinase n=1 Tax=Carboxylicivirga fragile TaxID=3417571 RepID=UPI003D331FE4|nr:tetratricopeptide repeat-containing sensor histidine kinase [Marinilabiliaceae bacterium N1Y90]